MAAPAAAAAASVQPPLAPDARWEDVVAYIDAMPGVPSWKQIEAEVDASVGAEIDDMNSNMTASDRAHQKLWERAIPHWIDFAWGMNLKKLYPHVSGTISSTRGGQQMIKHGAIAWFAVHRLPGGAVVGEMSISAEWIVLPEGHTPYGLQRLGVIDARAVLAAFNERAARGGGGFGHGDQRIAARFRADVQEHIERKMARTHMAQSGVIDLLARRQGTPMAQHIARYLAPNTVTPARPLAIRSQHAPTPITHQQYLASILAVARSGDPDPSATLARVASMLETLVGSVGMQD